MIRIDISDFFSSIGFGAVRNAFSRLGYNSGVSTCLALLCTDDRRVPYGDSYVATAPLHLPQGAPTSPALSNLFFYTADEALTEIARHLGFNFTRYSDDLFFSTRIACSSNNLEWRCRKLIGSVKFLLKRKRLSINFDKLSIMKSGRRQIVAGALVNNGLTVTRERKRNFRSVIRWCEQYDLHFYMERYVKGMWSWIRMIDSKYAEQIASLHPWVRPNAVFPYDLQTLSSWPRVNIKKVDVYVHRDLGLVFTNKHPHPQIAYESGITKYFKLAWVANESQSILLDWEFFINRSRSVQNIHVLNALAIRYGLAVQGFIETTDCLADLYETAESTKTEDDLDFVF